MRRLGVAHPLSFAARANSIREDQPQKPVDSIPPSRRRIFRWARECPGTVDSYRCASLGARRCSNGPSPSQWPLGDCRSKCSSDNSNNNRSSVKRFQCNGLSQTFPLQKTLAKHVYEGIEPTMGDRAQISDP